MSELDWQERVLAVLNAETDDLEELAKLAGADPRTFYRGANFRRADLRGEALHLFDLEEAVLANAEVDDLQRNLIDARRRVAITSPDTLERAVELYNLGIALENISFHTLGADHVALQEEALDSFRAALQLSSRQEQPRLWAMAVWRVGTLLHAEADRIGGPESDETLALAVRAYREAQQVFTEADSPLQWASTMGNIGRALISRYAHNVEPKNAILLEEAAEAFRAALRVVTEKERPLDWANTMQSLGDVLFLKGERTDGQVGSSYLKEALDAYRATLRVISPNERPLHWAQTLERMAQLEVALAMRDSAANRQLHLEAALELVDSGLGKLERHDVPRLHENMTKLRDDILDQLAALPPAEGWTA